MKERDAWWQKQGTPLVGVSLKSDHYSAILADRPALSFFEIHAENYMSDGGAHHRCLEEIADSYAISIHGVGLSLGSAEGLDRKHLQRFKEVVDRYNPALVSEHLAWSVQGGTYLNDLLPLPLTSECLRVVSNNINQFQDALGRKILVENPSSYVSFSESEFEEAEFLCRLAQTTGCGLLLDINNVYVSGKNMGWDPRGYLQTIPADLIGEIHLAGHEVKQFEGGEIRIDDHGSEVCRGVWKLYSEVIERIGSKPTLIEWDTNIPSFEQLYNQAHQAASIMVSARQMQVTASA